MHARAVLVLALAASLAGCGKGEPGGTAGGAPSPFEGGLAVSSEYGIAAIFPEGRAVCASSAGGDASGFFQWLDGDCSREGEPSDRFLSVRADYNADALSWAAAREAYCGAETEPFDLGVAPEGEGRLFTCKPRVCGKNYVITAVYLAQGLRQALFKPEDGPGIVYRVVLGTTGETEAKDLTALREFFSTLRLGGSGFRLAD